MNCFLTPRISLAFFLFYHVPNGISRRHSPLERTIGFFFLKTVFPPLFLIFVHAFSSGNGPFHCAWPQFSEGETQKDDDTSVEEKTTTAKHLIDQDVFFFRFCRQRQQEDHLHPHQLWHQEVLAGGVLRLGGRHRSSAGEHAVRVELDLR